jgi:hypothetical protein
MASAVISLTIIEDYSATVQIQTRTRSDVIASLNWIIHSPTRGEINRNMQHGKHNNESSFQCEANKFGNFSGSSTYPS